MNLEENRRRSTLIKIIIGVSAAAVIIFFITVSAILGVIINQQFYANRLNMDWWYYFTLNNSAILYVPLITIVVLACVVTVLNPLTSSTLNFLYGITQRERRPTKKGCLLWNYTVITIGGGLVAGWIIGFIQNVGYGIFVANFSGISYDFFPTFFSVLSYPLNPGTMDINVLFVYTFILRPFIVITVGAIMVKLGLDLVNSFAFQRRRGLSPLKVAGTASLIISLGFFIGWLYLPNGSYDVVGSSVALTVIAGFFTGLVLGVTFYILGIFNPVRYRGEQFYKTFLAIVIICMLVVPIGFLINAGVKNLYKEVNWNEWTWDTQLKTQIATTRSAAGITNFTSLTTQQLLDNQSHSGSTDEDIIPHVRTYDYQASRLSMENQIGTNWEELADSDIHYINGSEYWIAPRRIRPDYELKLDWVQNHIIYTHSRGFIALNPVTGKLIAQDNYPTIFGVPYNSSIYFGELPDNGYTLLNVTQFEEIENTTYSGPVDVSLSGFLNWWYIEDWGFKTFGQSNYLIKRNINDRISGILLPYMILGDDPYLVFETGKNKMYYCVDIILDIPSFSGYLQSDIVRWLGVVLVDTQYGSMNFYLYNNSYADLPYSFLNVYIAKYPWQPMPSWLYPQIKYPEILIEYQLSIDYTYHVTDAATWRSGNDFFERPEATDYHHIIYDIGYGPVYVGETFVEFVGATVGNLVGFYIMENGAIPDRLGHVNFYRNGTIGQTQMIGLTSATSAYRQRDIQFLELLSNPRFGNFLIYPLARSLYYVIPVYDTTGQGIETLKRVALVNVFNPSIIAIGNSTLEAYNALNVTTEIPPGILSLNVVSAPAIITQGIYDDLEILINNDYVDQAFNVSLEISTQYSLFNVSFGGQDLIPTINGGYYNYSIANLTILPTQYTGLKPKITGYVTGGQPFSPVNYFINLYFDNGTLIDSKQRTTYIYP
ncbi:MAG: UPF0182 family protein [Candidatus Helarchaeota archaeon]